ncbi:MAG: DnaD domain protein [Chloroflexaceae bacterium]|nr:DnaD domain protein [Chloroflexaceae bacterium]
MAFTGFSTEGLVSLPPEWFTQVLPAIVLPSELKVTLHTFYRLSQQRGTPRRISWEMLAQDALLLQGLRNLSKVRPPADLLAEGLAAAVQRTTLLHVPLADELRVVNWYVVHTAANRAWAEQLRLVQQVRLAEPDVVAAPPLNIVQLYEQNIGVVTPLLVDELRTAEERYPAAWIEAAMREAVRANARSWRYIQKVLERWYANGQPIQYASDQPQRSGIDVERYTSGAYGHLFRQPAAASEGAEPAEPADEQPHA